jgi:hypothetical protein
MTLQLCVLHHEPETRLGAFAAYLEAALVSGVACLSSTLEAAV